MSRRLSEIKRQNIAVSLSMLLECQHCFIQDFDMERITVGTPCTSCGAPSLGGRMVYSLRVLDLLEMIQAAFHAPVPEEQHLPGHDTAHREVSALTYICTFQEALMNQLLERFGIAKGIPAADLEPLLRKTFGIANRKLKLLPKWTGKAWDDMVKQEAAEHSAHYIAVDALMNQASKFRNRLLHEGAVYGLIDRSFVSSCIDALPVLMSFYADMHNRHVRPLLRAKAE